MHVRSSKSSCVLCSCCDAVKFTAVNSLFLPGDRVSTADSSPIHASFPRCRGQDFLHKASARTAAMAGFLFKVSAQWWESSENKATAAAPHWTAAAAENTRGTTLPKEERDSRRARRHGTVLPRGEVLGLFVCLARHYDNLQYGFLEQ